MFCSLFIAGHTTSIMFSTKIRCDKRKNVSYFGSQSFSLDGVTSKEKSAIRVNTITEMQMMTVAISSAIIFSTTLPLSHKLMKPDRVGIESLPNR